MDHYHLFYYRGLHHKLGKALKTVFFAVLSRHQWHSTFCHITYFFPCLLNNTGLSDLNVKVGTKK